MKVILVVRCNPENFVGRVSNYEIIVLHESSHIYLDLQS